MAAESFSCKIISACLPTDSFCENKHDILFTRNVLCNRAVCSQDVQPRCTHVGLFVVMSFVPAGRGACLCPHMGRTAIITDVMPRPLRRSNRVKPTPIVLNDKITPAWSAIIKLTHLIDLPHDFPTCIFSCFEIHCNQLTGRLCQNDHRSTLMSCC